MDSIVDSFFPFLDEIDKEVADIESLVYTSGTVTSSSPSQDPSSPALSTSSGSATVTSERSPGGDEKGGGGSGFDLTIKKEDTIHSAAAKTHFSLPRRRGASLRVFVDRGIEFMRSLLDRGAYARKLGLSITAGNVHRMARARRLVTSLTRFLHAKSEVVAQIKKRMLKTGEFGLGNGTGDDQDVFMYMGDVQGEVAITLSGVRPPGRNQIY